MEKKLPNQQRAYSQFTVKSVTDGDQRIVSGLATGPETDRVGDIVEPLGVQFKNPLPFLWQHNHDQPIGTVKFGKPTKDGITFEATIANIDEPGKLKDRCDEAWQTIKAGLVRGVSIGFRPIEYSFMDSGGVHFTKTEVYELSAVTIAAYAAATIQTIKQFDVGAPAAQGKITPTFVRLVSHSGDSGKKQFASHGAVKLIN